eukprot:COSAG04_NODE_4230_length_2221_cov_1.277097_1_plen_344_part_00
MAPPRVVSASLNTKPPGDAPAFWPCRGRSGLGLAGNWVVAILLLPMFHVCHQRNPARAERAGAATTPLAADSRRMKVLLTGGAGQVAQALVAGADPRLFTFRALDIVPTPNVEDHAVASCTDAEAVLAAAEGVDAIVHLTHAGGEHGDAPLETVDYAGAVAVFEAARQHGVARVGGLLPLPPLLVRHCRSLSPPDPLLGSVREPRGGGGRLAAHEPPPRRHHPRRRHPQPLGHRPHRAPSLPPPASPVRLDDGVVSLDRTGTRCRRCSARAWATCTPPPTASPSCASGSATSLSSAATRSTLITLASQTAYSFSVSLAVLPASAPKFGWVEMLEGWCCWQPRR